MASFDRTCERRCCRMGSENPGILLRILSTGELLVEFLEKGVTCDFLIPCEREGEREAKGLSEKRTHKAKAISLALLCSLLNRQYSHHLPSLRLWIPGVRLGAAESLLDPIARGKR